VANNLNDNMKTGLEVVRRVRKDIPKSMNYDSTSSAITSNGVGLYSGGLSSAAQFSNVRNQVITKLQNANYQAFWKTSTNRALVREVYELVQSSDTGNCLEQAFYTAHILKGKGKRVDVVRVKPTNPNAITDTAVVPHWFAVIGRTLGSNDNKTIIGLPDSWGNTAVVVDSWDKSVYPASLYRQFWNGLTRAARGNTLTTELWVRI